MSNKGDLRCVVSVAAIALSIGSCATYGTRPESPAHGGRTWTEATSPHFRVVADLAPDEAQAMALELEQGLDALGQVAFEHARTQVESTTVVVFSEGSDFHAFMPELVEGSFYRKLPSDLEPARFVILHGTLSTESRIAFLHELTHDLFERNFGPAPPWLNEGWAEYYSTIEIEPDRIRVGAALPHLTFTTESEAFAARADDGSMVLAMPIAQVAAPSELLRLQRRDFYASSLLAHPDSAARERSSALYFGSWALVHMLHDGPEPYPTRFKRFLSDVRQARVETAWQSAFAGVSAEAFDHDFRQYLAARQLAVFEFGKQKTDNSPPIRSRTLTDAEVHVLWARLCPWQGASGEAAERDLDEAVAEAPSSPEPRYFRGLYWMKQHRLDDANDDLAAAVRLAPSDPRYLLGLLTLRAEQEPQSAEHVHAGDAVMQVAEPLAKVARTAMQLQALAAVYDDLGDRNEALTYAERAVALSPIDSWALDVEAQVLSHLGRSQDAVDAERAAVAFLPEGANAPDIARRLQTYEVALRAAPH